MERHAGCPHLLKRIARKLAQHQKEQAAAPDDWGFPDKPRLR